MNAKEERKLSPGFPKLNSLVVSAAGAAAAATYL
jgi:hypothetical protein